MWSHAVGTIGTIASGLLMLGLVGTVIGFMHALGADTLQGALSGDTNAFKTLIVQISSGTGIALQTTLLGSLGYLWLAMNRSAVKNIIFSKWLAALAGMSAKEDLERFASRLHGGIAEATAYRGAEGSI
jgi:hypothetical protein